MERDLELVEDLVVRCLEALDRDDHAEVDRILAEQPSAASQVRSHLRSLRRLGLCPSTDATTPHPERLGRYVIVRPLGHGGMSTVFLAEDHACRRTVALKVLRGEMLFTPEGPARLRREVAALARLRHPGIVQVHDVGEQEGVPYLVMEHVAGATLAALLDELGSASPERLHRAEVRAAYRRASGLDDADPLRGRDWVGFCTDLALEAAQALEHAHQHGVYHRDLKPSNLVVTPCGHVRVIDFGLACTPEASRLTRSGAAPGSLPYLPPELLRGRPADPALVDVYQLGVTLYEAITLHPPYSGPDQDTIRARILEATPAPAQQRNRRIGRDLETVCGKAIAPEPARRYPTMRALAGDLRRVRRGEPVLARRPGPWLRLRRFAQRRPARSAAALVGFAALVITPLTVAVLEARARREIERLSDAYAARQLLWAEGQMWPLRPEMVDGPQGYDAWIAQAERLCAARGRYEARLRELRRAARRLDPGGDADPRFVRLRWRLGILKDQLAGIRRYVGFAQGRDVREFQARIRDLEHLLHERLAYRFADPTRQWEHATLVDLVRDLDRLEELLPDMRRRRDLAAGLDQRTLVAEAAAWNETIARARSDPRYENVKLRPLRGLVPLGPDPRTGLLEFAHVLSGAVPRRDPRTGRLRVGEDTAIVFVLLPGGRFRMGARRPDPSHPPGSPHVDPDARTEGWGAEVPVHEVELDPFLVSKYELTQGQWFRLTHRRPATYAAGDAPMGERKTDRHPVETVTFERCEEVLSRFGMALPSEAQWEYAARGGTASVTPWGDVEDLEGAANLADASWYAAHSRPGPERVPEGSPHAPWSDGYVLTAPVGRYRPNGFGLHDVIGNVAEWCDGGMVFYDRVPAAAGTGKRWGRRANGCVVRGGSYLTPPRQARVAARSQRNQAFWDLGVRPVILLVPR